MNTLTIETTTGAATLSAGALEITNDIIPFKVSFTTGGVDSTTNVAQLGYSDLGLGGLRTYEKIKGEVDRSTLKEP